MSAKTKKRQKKIKIKRMDKYWICSTCVATKHPDWGDPGVCTAIYGYCGHCKSTVKEGLIPTVDYPKPGHNVIWD